MLSKKLLSSATPPTPPTGSFSYTPEATLAPFTSRWDAAFALEYSAGPPAAIIHGAGGSGRVFFSIDELSGVDLSSVGDIELLARYHIADRSNSNLAFGFVARGSGDGTSETGYACLFRNNRGNPELELLPYVNGTAGAFIVRNNVNTTVNTDGIEYYYRMSVTGASPVRLKQKVWKVTDVEPTAWNNDYPDSAAVPATGRFGLQAFSQGNPLNKILFIGVGIDGATAPLS